MVRLKQIRKANGYTAKALADKVGVHEITLFRWESGDRTPTLKHLRSLMRTLNCTLDDLYPEASSA